MCELSLLRSGPPALLLVHAGTAGSALFITYFTLVRLVVVLFAFSLVASMPVQKEKAYLFYFGKSFMQKGTLVALGNLWSPSSGWGSLSCRRLWLWPYFYFD